MAKSKNNNINSFAGLFSKDNTEEITNIEVAENARVNKEEQKRTSTKRRVNIYIDGDLQDKLSYLAWLERKSFSAKLSELIEEYAELNQDKLADGEYKNK